MRPRRRILLIDPDEDRRGEFRFMLEVQGYRVIEHARGEINLIIARWPVASGVCKRLKKNNPNTPLAIMHSPVDVLSRQSPMIQSADAVWTSQTPRIELLIEIHKMSASKRGPKRGVFYPKMQHKVEAAA